MNEKERILFDAGLFIAALLKADPRHQEARMYVEAARAAELPVCTTAGILSEVYAALTWEKAQPSHSPATAAEAVRLICEPPSEIVLLPETLESCILMLDLSAKYGLTARRVHDARHAATALAYGLTAVYTYDFSDWRRFEPEGLKITGPPSILEQHTAK